MSETTVIKKDSYYRDVLKKFTAHKLAMIGVAIIVLEVLLVIFLPMILKLDPYTSDILAFSAKPGPGHFLGTDDTGRDVFARLVYGGRVSLMVGLLSAVISLLIGVPLGLVAGYYKGIWETIVMRAADIFMSFPSMILVLVLVSVIGPSVWTVTLVIGVLGWTDFDIRQCIVGQGKGICGIGQGRRYQGPAPAVKVCGAQCIRAHIDKLYIPYRTGHHPGIRT